VYVQGEEMRMQADDDRPPKAKRAYKRKDTFVKKDELKNIAKSLNIPEHTLKGMKKEDLKNLILNHQTPDKKMGIA